MSSAAIVCFCVPSPRSASLNGRERARTALHPEQARMQQELAKSRDDLRGGLEAARRMVRERCQMGQDVASTSEALARAKPAAA